MPNEDEQVRIQLNTGMEWSSNNVFKLLLLLLLLCCWPRRQAATTTQQTADSRRRSMKNRLCAVRRIVVVTVMNACSTVHDVRGHLYVGSSLVHAHSPTTWSASWWYTRTVERHGQLRGVERAQCYDMVSFVVLNAHSVTTWSASWW